MKQLLTVAERKKYRDALNCPTLEAFEAAAIKSYLLKRLREHNWDAKRTADRLKIGRTTLYRYMENLDIERESPVVDGH